MSRMKSVSMLTLLGLSLFAANTFAQTPPAQNPKPQTPPATQTPAGAQKPAAPTAPPAAATAAPIVPLPAGAVFATIDPDTILAESVAGKAAIAQVRTLADKRSAEIQNIQTQINALQQKKQAGAMLTQQAAAQIDKDIERLNLDMQYKQSGAQKEVQDLQNDLFGELGVKMQPVLEAFAKEKGLMAVFDVRNGVTWAAAGMDISMEIVKRLDALKK